MAGCCDDTEWILERIAATKLAILAYEEAILALSSGAQSYRLSTGQTDQSVTKASLPSLYGILDSLENRLQYYQHKLCGGASIYVKPAW